MNESWLLPRLYIDLARNNNHFRGEFISTPTKESYSRKVTVMIIKQRNNDSFHFKRKLREKTLLFQNNIHKGI